MTIFLPKDYINDCRYTFTKNENEKLKSSTLAPLAPFEPFQHYEHNVSENYNEMTLIKLMWRGIYEIFLIECTETNLRKK